MGEFLEQIGKQPVTSSINPMPSSDHCITSLANTNRVYGIDAIMSGEAYCDESEEEAEEEPSFVGSLTLHMETRISKLVHYEGKLHHEDEKPNIPTK